MGKSVSFVFAIFMLISCGDNSSEEDQIRSAITTIQTAIEEKSAHEALAVFAEDFVGNRHLHKPDLQRMMLLQMLRHQTISIVFTRIHLDFDAINPHKAMIKTTAVITGASGWIPDDGRIYQLTGQWRKHAGNWLITTLNWD